MFDRCIFSPPLALFIFENHPSTPYVLVSSIFQSSPIDHAWIRTTHLSYSHHRVPSLTPYVLPSPVFPLCHLISSLSLQLSFNVETRRRREFNLDRIDRWRISIISICVSFARLACVIVSFSLPLLVSLIDRSIGRCSSSSCDGSRTILRSQVGKSRVATPRHWTRFCLCLSEMIEKWENGALAGFTAIGSDFSTVHLKSNIKSIKKHSFVCHLTWLFSFFIEDH